MPSTIISPIVTANTFDPASVTASQVDFNAHAPTMDQIFPGYSNLLSGATNVLNRYLQGGLTRGEQLQVQSGAEARNQAQGRYGGLGMSAGLQQSFDVIQGRQQWATGQVENLQQLGTGWANMLEGYQALQLDAAKTNASLAQQAAIQNAAWSQQAALTNAAASNQVEEFNAANQMTALELNQKMNEQALEFQATLNEKQKEWDQNMALENAKVNLEAGAQSFNQWLSTQNLDLNKQLINATQSKLGSSLSSFGKGAGADRGAGGVDTSWDAQGEPQGEHGQPNIFTPNPSVGGTITNTPSTTPIDLLTPEARAAAMTKFQNSLNSLLDPTGGYTKIVSDFVNNTSSNSVQQLPTFGQDDNAVLNAMAGQLVTPDNTWQEKDIMSQPLNLNIIPDYNNE